MQCRGAGETLLDDTPEFHPAIQMRRLLPRARENAIRERLREKAADRIEPGVHFRDTLGEREGRSEIR